MSVFCESCVFSG